MIEIKSNVPRGMIFIYDYESDDVLIPEYSPDVTVSKTPSALSVAVLSDEDGEVDIGLYSLSECKVEKKMCIFSDSINIPKGVLSICFMGDEQVASLKSKTGNVKIKIFVDVEPFPEVVSIYVEQ